MNEAEAQAVIDRLNRQMLAALMVLPHGFGPPPPPPCPVCGLGRLRCELIFSRHRDRPDEAREFLARHPLAGFRDNQVRES